MLYTIDISSDVIRGIDYRGKIISNYTGKYNYGSPVGNRLRTLALSLQHDAIFWADNLASMIEGHGIRNEASVKFSFSTDHNSFIVGISVYNGRLYWAQKVPMNIYYTEWQREGSKSVKIRSFPSSSAVRDITLVAKSLQPLKCKLLVNKLCILLIGTCFSHSFNSFTLRILSLKCYYSNAWHLFFR